MKVIQFINCYCKDAEKCYKLIQSYYYFLFNFIIVIIISYYYYY